MPTVSAVSAVLFDLGGVYYTEGFHDGLFAIARELGQDEEPFFQQGVAAVFTTGYVEGRCPERAFWAELARRTGAPGDLFPLRERILSAFRPQPGMTELVRRVREKVKVGLLTDQTNWLYELEERDGFFPEFDQVISSYEEGITKRDHAMFRLACERFSLLPERIAFLDDNPGNVERAREFGMRAFLFHTPAEADADLRRAGVLG